MKVSLSRNNTFPNDLIIIDGQGRSGKNLIAVLLGTMNCVGKMRLDSQFDYIPRYWALGKMTEDAAIVALRTEFDEKLYYDSISRDMNFRWDDYTGVFKQGKWLAYIKNLFLEPSSAVVRQIVNDRRIFQQMTHDGIQFFELFNSAFGNRLKLIHVLRNPIHNIFEQNRRGLGVRIGADPSELQLCFKHALQDIPLMAAGKEELWLRGNNLERLIVCVESMFRKNIDSLEKSCQTSGHQIFTIEFEHFVHNPFGIMRKLESFVGQKFGTSTSRILRRENCPRKVERGLVDDRAIAISREIDKVYWELLSNMLSDYNKFIVKLGLE
jgi:hypothetical protein